MIQKVKIELDFNRHSEISEEYLLGRLETLLKKLENSEILDSDINDKLEYEFELLNAKIVEDE